MISVCMPYWDRQAALDRMFANYAAVYPELAVEFSICDDGAPVPARVPEGVILTRLPTKHRALNPCVPINRAVAASSADVIVLTNPEIEHREPTLHRMLELLEHEDDYVSACCFDERRGWLAGPEVNYQAGGRLPVPPGAHFHFCVMFTRALWEKAGGFDEDYRTGLACDDNDWVWRAHRAGARFKTCPSVVHHTHDGPGIRWNLPHNRTLFLAKWPEAARG